MSSDVPAVRSHRKWRIGATVLLVVGGLGYGLWVGIERTREAAARAH